MQTLGHIEQLSKSTSLCNGLFLNLGGFKKSSLLQARGLHAAAEVQQCGGRGATGVPGLNQSQDQPDILPQRHR
jgi:hypothetical protein